MNAAPRIPSGHGPMTLVVMATEGQHTDILVNWLDDAGFPPAAVLVEPAQSRRALLRGRARKLGWAAVAGQLAFMALVPPLLRRLSRGRVQEILRAHGLRTDPLNETRLTRIASVNTPEAAAHLRRLSPDAVVLSGTRIVRPATLDATAARFLNIHAGITPAYRGVHGGFWALWSGQPDDFGATLHLVDTGVDTGGVLAHCRARPASADTFATYPLIQLASALPALTACLEQLCKAPALRTLSVPGEPSRQWYHPTIAQYLAGLLRGVR